MKCQFSRFARSFPEAYPYFVWLCPTNRERYTKGTKRSRKKHKKLSFSSLTRRSDPRCGGAILDDSEVAVAFGFASGVVRRFVHRVPVCSAVDKVHARDFVLKQPCAAVMVGVRMREDDVFDLTAIQVELSHAAEDFVLRRIIEQCLEDDDAPVAYDCPRIMNLGAEEIEVVGDLGRFSIPGFSRRRSGRGSARASSCARGGGGGRRRRRRWNAEAKKGARPLQAGRILGRPDQTVDRSGNRLRQCAPGACKK